MRVPGVGGSGSPGSCRSSANQADWTYEAVFAALIGGLVGSRLDYIIQNWDKVSATCSATSFPAPGWCSSAGLIGGAVGVLLWARWRGFLGWELLDSAAAPIAIGYAVGRIGCQLSGDGDYGEPSDLPWAMSYPEGTVPTTERGPPDAGLRDVHDGSGHPAAVEPARPAGARACCSAST